MIPGTHELSDINYPKKHTLVAIFNLAPVIWTTVLAVWLVFLVSAFFSFDVPASGAVMVGGALISEMFFEQLRWRKLPCDPDGQFYLVPDAETKRPIAQNKYWIAPAGTGKLGALLSLSRTATVKMNPRETEVSWYYKEAVENAEKIIFRVILITAICGTLIWGYGHRIFGFTCCGDAT